MNYTYNDRGERIPAVGAPNSITRLRHERPVLIAELQAMGETKAKVYLKNKSYHFVPSINQQWRDNLLKAAFPSLLTQINFALEDRVRGQ